MCGAAGKSRKREERLDELRKQDEVWKARAARKAEQAARALALEAARLERDLTATGAPASALPMLPPLVVPSPPAPSQQAGGGVRSRAQFGPKVSARKPGAKRTGAPSFGPYGSPYLQGSASMGALDFAMSKLSRRLIEQEDVDPALLE